MNSSELSFLDMLSFHFCLENIKIMWMLLSHRKISGITTAFASVDLNSLHDAFPHILSSVLTMGPSSDAQVPLSLQWGCAPPWRHWPWEQSRPCSLIPHAKSATEDGIPAAGVGDLLSGSLLTPAVTVNLMHQFDWGILVKHYSGRVFESVLGWDQHLNG